MANAVRLTQFQTDIANSIARSDNNTWHCNLCQDTSDKVIKIVMHALVHCPNSACAGPRANASTSTVLKICAFLDPVGCSHDLEVMLRVKKEDGWTDSEDESENDDGKAKKNPAVSGERKVEDHDGESPTEAVSGEIPMRLKFQHYNPKKSGFTGKDVESEDVETSDVEGEGVEAEEEEEEEEVEDDIDEDADIPDEDNPDPNERHTFSPTPPDLLKDSEKRDWVKRQLQATRIREVMEANRSTEPFKRAAVDPGAAVKDWNKTYGHLPGYKRYGKYPALSSRLSRDKLLLRKHLRTAMAREGKQEQM